MSDQEQRNIGTAEHKAAWQARKNETRALGEAESAAAALVGSIPGGASSSSAMQLHLAGLPVAQDESRRMNENIVVGHRATVLEARALREARRAADISARSANAVADMHWCIDNLAVIRADVGDSRHSDWSDFWEVGYKKHKPWAKNTFVPKRLALGTNSMWAPFYHGSPDVPDDRDPPYFRVYAELFGRMLHTLGREYISRDDNRKISAELNKHLTENVAKVQEAMVEAGKTITDRHQMQMRQHEDMMVKSRQAIEAA